MSYPSLIAIVIAVACGIRFGLENTLEDTLVFALTLAIVLSMIVFSSFVVRYGLNLGIMASLAKDSKTPEHSAPAIALLGWIALIVICYFVFF